ncbi:MAG: hypothetical protein ACI86C_001349, partial [Candidatus Latescibacterota bacterium]
MFAYYKKYFVMIKKNYPLLLFTFFALVFVSATNNLFVPDTEDTSSNQLKQTYLENDSYEIVTTYVALADLCIDAGVQVGLDGGLPTGGVYSGVGVTDDGNGMSYSFNPAVAGSGIHTLTYTEGGVPANDDVEVFALPSVTMTGQPDLCIDAGVQLGLSGGLPIGGAYFGIGVTDAGDGMTYSFNPALAGSGTSTLIYFFTDANGCSDNATNTVTVIALDDASYSYSAGAYCVDATDPTPTITGLAGGTFSSGAGLIINGTTGDIDVSASTPGTYTVTYTTTGTCPNTSDVSVTINALPVVTFAVTSSPVCPGVVLTSQDGGAPTGGVYSGPGVTDDGNGMTYSFDAGAAGNGVHTLTYTFTDANGCTNSSADTVTVEDTTPPVITCPADITVNNDSGVCGAAVTYAAPVGTDNCSGSTTAQTLGFPSGSVFPIGTTTNTFVVTDAAGLTATCSFDVTVTDTEVPVITCPADIAVNNDSGVCGAAVTYTAPVGTDNCS